MRQTLTRFTKMMAGYSLYTLLGPLSLLILTPLYTRVLSPSDYGVVDIALTLSIFLTAFATLGFHQALNAFFFDGDIEHRRDLITTAVLSVSLLGIILMVCLALVGEALAILLFDDPAYSFIIYFLTLNLVSVPIYNVLGATLRLKMEVKRVNILGFGNLLATITLNVLLILVFRLKSTGIIAAHVLTNLLSCGLALFLARDFLRGNFLRSLFKPLLYAGLGLLPGIFGFALLSNIDRLLLTQYVSQHEIGLYSIANKLAAMLTVLFTAAWSAWTPMALELAEQSDAPRQFARMFEYFICAALFFALGIGLFAEEILVIFTDAPYLPAAPFAAILLIYTGPLINMTNFFSIGLYAHKQTHLISVAFLIAAGVNIALNLLLNPILGTWGAVWSTVLAGAVWVSATYIFGQRTLPVKYRWTAIFMMGVTYSGCIGLFLLLPELNNLWAKISIMVIFMSVIPLTGIIPLSHVRFLIEIIHHRFVSRLFQG